MNSFNNANGWLDGTYDLGGGGAGDSNAVQRHQLVVDGNAGDSVYDPNPNWQSVGQVSSGAGILYDVYNQGLYAQLLVNHAVQQNLMGAN